MKVLFVCTGNICRSPMAEIIFTNICKENGRGDVIVKGAGTGTCGGEKMTDDARTALKLCGEKISRKKHLSTRFDDTMVSCFDWIITMTHAHAETVGRYPNVKSLDELTGCGDIFDPYLYPVDAYIEVCRKLQQALPILYKEIIK